MAKEDVKMEYATAIQDGNHMTAMVSLTFQSFASFSSKEKNMMCHFIGTTQWAVY